MSEIISKLAEIRRRRELVEKIRDAALEKLKEIELYQQYLEACEIVKQIKAEEDRETDMVRDYFVSQYDGENKKPYPAVTIGIYTTINHCIEHNLPTLLNLNKSEFEKAAKVGIFNFVILGKETRAKIATDLSEYIEP